MKVAICVGHSRNGDNGALSVDGVAEWAFNSQLALALSGLLTARGHTVSLINRYAGNGYAEAMADAARSVSATKANVAIELHFNASDNERANGHEWLYWHASGKSKTLANWFDACFDDLPLHSRGILPRFRSDRGALFLRKTHCPALICEPFFGTNRKDWEWVNRYQHKIVEAMADALDGYAKEVGV